MFKVIGENSSKGILKIQFNVVVFFFFLSQVSLADTFYFEQMNLKPENIQIELLQKRMKKDSQSPLRIFTVDNTLYYMYFDSLTLDSKFKFINSLVAASNQVEFKKETSIGIYEYCQSRLASCMPFLEPYLDCKDSEACRKKTLTLFKPDNFDVIVKHQEFFKKILTYAAGESTLTLETFKTAVTYGYVDIAEKIFTRYKFIRQNNNIAYYVCAFYLLKKDLQSAKKCSMSVKNPWFKILEGYIYVLENNQFNQDEYEEIVKNLLNSEPERAKLFVYVMSAILFKKMIALPTQDDLRRFSEDYWNGFMLLSLDKKYHFLSDASQKKLEDDFLGKFNNSLLVQILKGVEKKDILMKEMGEFSVLYQSVK